jgi:hypothetical protein
MKFQNDVSFCLPKNVYDDLQKSEGKYRGCRMSHYISKTWVEPIKDNRLVKGDSA